MSFWYSRLRLLLPGPTPAFIHIPAYKRVKNTLYMPRTRRGTRSSTNVAAESPQDAPLPKKPRRLKTKTPTREDAKDDPCEHPEEAKSRRARKSKAKDADSQTFLPRVNSPWKVGAHVSASGGVENAVMNAAIIGANAFALFLKSQRKWNSPALTEQTIKSFKARMDEYKYSPDVVLPHGSYLINLGNPDADKREKSYECFLDDLKRCELLGLKLYNFHPGSTVGNATKEESISLIAQCINRAHRETKSVVTVIENMVGAGNVIGGDFADLGGIINEVEDKSRVGVCLDTCHSFAAGYDLRTEASWNEMRKMDLAVQDRADFLLLVTKFNEQVGLSYLRGMHLNDSKADLGSKKDRHENIGLGFLGHDAFRHAMNDTRIQNIPLILETPSFERPSDVWGKEIAVLYQLSTITAESEENEKALRSVIGDAQTGDALVEVIRSAVKTIEGAKGNRKGEEKAKKSRKRKRTEDSEEKNDEDE